MLLSPSVVLSLHTKHSKVCPKTNSTLNPKALQGTGWGLMWRMSTKWWSLSSTGAFPAAGPARHSPSGSKSPQQPRYSSPTLAVRFGLVLFFGINVFCNDVCQKKDIAALAQVRLKVKSWW